MKLPKEVGIMSNGPWGDNPGNLEEIWPGNQKTHTMSTGCQGNNLGGQEVI